jgi:type VII secretion integral membrane protein EccD
MGLVRVTIAAPQRRVDLALPERAPVAEMLPGLLRHAGEALADEGVPDGGWVLRRADGTTVDAARTLAAQRIHDGEVLHLVTHRTPWPELEYDDLVEAIAGGAGRAGRPWGPAQTRSAALTCAGAAVLLALGALLRDRGPASGWAALGVAALLLATGTVLARAFADAGTGAVLAGLALPAAFTGGALLLAGTPLLGGGTPLPGGAGPLPGGALNTSGGALMTSGGAAALLGGCAFLLVTAVLAQLGVVDRPALFVGAATLALLGGLAACLTTIAPVDATGAAAALAALVFLFAPLVTPLAVRLGRVPMPVLPRTPEDLARDDPAPPRHAVYAAVLRADGLLTGMLAGAATAAGLALVVVAHGHGPAVVALLALLAAGFAIRARLYPAIRQRLPLLMVALTAATGLAAGPLATGAGRGVPVLIAVAAAAVLIGLVYSRRAPGAFAGRYAELLEVVLVLACLPVVCAVLGLYGRVRGWGG